MRRIMALLLTFLFVGGVSVLAAEEEKEFKFAYVDMEKIIDGYVLFADARKQAETKIREAQLSDRAELEKYQAAIDELENKLAGPLTPEAKTQAEQEYKAKVEEALEFRDGLLSKYKKIERDAFEPVYKKVYEKVKSYADKNGYKVVFDYSATLLYAAPQYDITDKILMELNEEAGVGP